jgi:hypothetical protein
VKALLRHIFGILPAVRYALRHRDNFLSVTKNQFLERLRISTLRGGH